MNELIPDYSEEKIPGFRPLRLAKFLKFQAAAIEIPWTDGRQPDKYETYESSF